MLKQAMTELIEAMRVYGAKDLLQDLEDNDSDVEISLGNLLDPSSEDHLE